MDRVPFTKVEASRSSDPVEILLKQVDALLAKIDSMLLDTKKITKQLRVEEKE
jgi:hypothetical protein